MEKETKVLQVRVPLALLDELDLVRYPGESRSAAARLALWTLIRERRARSDRPAPPHHG